MRSRRDPFKSYSVVAVTAPILFAAGMIFFHADRVLGDQARVSDSGGVVGLATNLSFTGLTAVVRIFVAYGPYVLILLGLALPVAGALYILDRLESRRGTITSRRRSLLWVLAWSETLAMAGLFLLMPTW